MKPTILPIITALVGAPACASATGANDLVESGLFSAVILTSDYRYEGVSESRGHPEVQAYVHWYRPDGFYAGVFVTGVDFGYRGAPTYEVDSYAGRNFTFDAGKTELKLEGMYSAYPNNETPGPTLNFFQAKVQLKHTFGPWTTIGLVSYVPRGSYGSGEVRRVEGETDFAASKTLTLKASLGDQGGGVGHTRVYWSLGVAKTWKTVTFDLRYFGTDRTRRDCGFQSKACDPAIVGSVTISLPPVVLGRMVR